MKFNIRILAPSYCEWEGEVEADDIQSACEVAMEESSMDDCWNALEIRDERPFVASVCDEHGEEIEFPSGFSEAGADHALLVSRRELATILAALRHWQDSPQLPTLGVINIATDDGEIEALTRAEIDELAERINMGV